MFTISLIHNRNTRHLVFGLATAFTMAASSMGLQAATMQAGNITTQLGPTFFVDDATNGGSDTDIHQPSAPVFNRKFNGLLTRNQGPTRVVLTGFGFATHTSATANDATAVAVTFTYLGQDELPGGGDDVVIGTATGAFVFTPSAQNPNAEYAFAFDAPLAADLNITGTTFRIQLAPSNDTNNGSLKLKSGALDHETFTGTNLSVAGVIAPQISPQRVNLAKFQSVTGGGTVAGQRLASYLTDGVTGNDNRWQSDSWKWNTARVDFPFPVEVGSAQVFTGINDTSPLSNFSIQYLNGSTWITIPGGSTTGSINTNVERNLIFTNPITATSFRIIGEDNPLRVRELALYPPNGPTGYPLGTDLTINLAYQRPAVATAHTVGFFPLKAVDGRAHIGSAWQTNTAGVNTLDIDLRVLTKIGSAHLYSGAGSILPLSDFILKYWDASTSTWLEIPGGTIAGNSTSDLVVTFSTPVTTTQIRLEFTNPAAATAAIRELCVFPANTGNVGYSIGTNLITSGAIADFETFNDSFYLITNPTSGRYMAVPNSGQPSLNQTGLTTGQGQYQILLNHSNGTYRLRNRASGNCLSGAQLSKTPGLPLTDAPYTALPHQDWILDPLGGGVYRLINQWSGLVIDTEAGATSAGTALVQNTASSATSQRWQFSKFAGASKKGIGGTTFAMATNPSWAYNWGRFNPDPIPPDAVHFPMQWGNFSWDINTAQGPLWQNYPTWRTRSDGIHLLGFNEPDRTDQSNMSLSTVISLWPRLQELDLPLVSPAPGTASWLNDFYPEAERLGYRVDYTAIHTYPGPSGSSDNLVSLVQSSFNSWQRPVWLTEFSFVDWGKNQSWSEEDSYHTLAEFLWRAESLTELRKYALFIFTEDAEYPQPANPWQAFTPAPRSNSYDLAGNLTAFGKLYAAWDSDTTVRTDKTYYIHHKSSHKRLANLLTSTPGGRTIRVDGPAVNWTLAPTGTSGRYYVVSSRDGRRLSSLSGAAPTLAAAGTTGPDVEWSLTARPHGWFYLEHPASSRRLQLSFNNTTSEATYSMVANTLTGDALEWRFIVPLSSPVWTGTAGSSWVSTNSWASNTRPTTGDAVIFNEASTTNLATSLNQDFDLGGLTVKNPSGPVSINGTHTLRLGSGGIDLSAATQDLAITTPLIINEAQSWNVTTGRSLAVNGGISGAFGLALNGTGTIALGAAVNPLTALNVSAATTLKTSLSSVLASGATATNLSLDGTLDLNGTAQNLNFINGSGPIRNTALAPASLTIGLNNVGGTLNTPLQSALGPLTLIKTGSANLTLPIANTHSGGFTNGGGGSVYPQHNDAFGTGPVVMNGGNIITVLDSYVFNNALTLNGSSLRVAGGNSRTITWDGPVVASGASGLVADGGTNGITINGNLDIAGASFSSVGNGLTHTINGEISGAGGNLIVVNGILVLNNDSLHGGTTTINNDAFLRLSANGTLPPSGNIYSEGGLTIRNTVSWIHNGDITGDGTAALSLNTGSNATLAGNISGHGSINVNNAGTDVTISGHIGGPANINVQNSVDAFGVGAILRLAGPNTYTGATTVTRGKLILAASNVLPDTTALSIGNATLDAETFTDTAGTLDVISTATIQLGTDATLAFADSSAVSWSGGSLKINGDFTEGSSIRFGTYSGGLTPTQLALITVNGAPGPFILNDTGFLAVPITDPFDLWKTQITNGQDGRNDDADADSFSNLQEFLFGTSPIAGNGSLVTTTSNNGNLVLSWLQRENGATYTLKESTTLAIDSWTTVIAPNPVLDVDQTGAPVDYEKYSVTLPSNDGKRFFCIEAVENTP